MKILSIVLAFAVTFFAYKSSVKLGLIVTAVLVLWGIYSFIPAYYSLMAQRAFADGDFKKSEKLYAKAIKTGRAKIGVRINYAYILMRTGKFDKAEEILNAIVRTKSQKFEKDRQSAKLQRCMVYYKQDRLDEAIEEAEEMYNDGLRTTQLYAMLGYFKIISNDNIDDVTKFCLEAYEYNDDDRDIMDNLSLCYYKKGDYDKAKELSDKIIKEAPKFVEAYYHGAQIAVKLGDYKKAKELMSHIDECRWSQMTTVSHEEVDELNKLISRRI